MTKTFTLILGIVLTAVGIWGFSTGGHNHNLILFGINANHNLVHILSGVLALIAGLKGGRLARAYLLVFGAVYALAAFGGFLNVAFIVNLLNLNEADNFLHLAIGVLCLGVGLKKS